MKSWRWQEQDPSLRVFISWKTYQQLFRLGRYNVHQIQGKLSFNYHNNTYIAEDPTMALTQVMKVLQQIKFITSGCHFLIILLKPTKIQLVDPSNQHLILSIK